MDVVTVFGLISLLADFVYEGGRSLIPVVLKGYGLEAISFLSGLSEGLGYAFRALSGLLADKLGAHWTFMFVGYLAVLAYPLSALWPAYTTFALAIIVERLGKALRSPAKDALVASNVEDPGRAFGLIETMDQIGAIMGPAVAALAIALASPREALLLYFVPGTLLIPLLLKLKGLKAKPKKKEVVWRPSAVALFAFAVGASFPQPIMIAGGAEEAGLSAPLAYALAMLVDAALAYPLGALYSRARSVLFVAPLLALTSLSLYFPFLAPLAGAAFAFEEVVLKSVIAESAGSGALYGTAYALLGAGSFLAGVIMPKMTAFELALYSASVSALGLLALHSSTKASKTA